MVAGTPGAAHSRRRGILLRFLAVGLAVITAACLGGRPSVGTAPPNLESLEGYASWRIARDGAAARSRFSFLLVLPDRGLIEFHDPLNRAVARLLVEGETAYLVMPGKRAYWRAGRHEVMTRLLGFDFAPDELSGLLTGGTPALSGWSLDADERGRVVGGRRGDLVFTVREFFAGGPLPRSVTLTNGVDQGRLRILRLRFNPPPKEAAFRLSFLDDGRYRAVGWPEIEKWLRDED